MGFNSSFKGLITFLNFNCIDEIAMQGAVGDESG